ncbi:MAG: aldehyde dehydrogenase family protein [Alphaproteobacteria bacterium]|nr:MAG: aldehyde dehydrogenase family protein [Alphaproteobacteria bacterium]
MSAALEVRNPRTGTLDDAIVPPTPAALAQACADLRAAQADWLALGLEGRIAAFQALKAALAEHRGHLIEALAQDTGRAMLSALEYDGLAPAIDRLMATARAHAQAGEHRAQALPHVRFKTQCVPYNLVGVISPWNFPLTLSLIDALPALLAGAAVAIKPSEVTPRFARPLRTVFAAVPAMAPVVHIFDGDGATGAALIDHVDAICFTGSVATGAKVAQAAARAFIPAFLELGGKDPAIVLDDADVARAATALLRGSVLNTGQACQSIERIYVARPIYDHFVALLVAGAKAVTLNAQDVHHGQLGPIIHAPQADIIRAHLDDARAKGARILTGGEIEVHNGGGLWCRPTVLVDVTPDMAIMREESFGPLLPVAAFDSEDEAVAAANDSDYGLSAAVFSRDLARAQRVAERLDVGAVSINDAALTGLMHEAEKHAFKRSGMGASRMGASGYLRFLRKKALIFNDGQPFDIAWFDEAKAVP